MPWLVNNACCFKIENREPPETENPGSTHGLNLYLKANYLNK